MDSQGCTKGATNMKLTTIQQKQVLMQLKKHQRKTIKASVELAKGKKLGFSVQEGVFGSDIMSSGIYLAKFLFAQKKLYKGKACLDMGCGPGTQGLIMALYGGKSVDFSDINAKAVANTRKNVAFHNLNLECNAYVSDLFKQIPKKQYDIIVFNHPFFPEEAKNFGSKVTKDVMLRKSMLGGTTLLQKFMSEVGTYLKKDGILIMPYFHFAGEANDPAMHIKKYNLNIIHEYLIRAKQGIQLGKFSIYLMKRK
jgi:methylase of polypeptide subunit release factors